MGGRSTRDEGVKEIGARIRAARVAIGWTQEQLSAAFGRKGNSWVAEMEAGRAGVSVALLLELSRVLVVDPIELATGLDLENWKSSVGQGSLDLVRGIGGPSFPAPGASNAGLALPREPLLAVWPSHLINPQDLPMRDALSLAVEAVSERDQEGAFLCPIDEESFVFVPRGGFWRDAGGSAGIGHRVIALLPAPRPPARRAR